MRIWFATALLMAAVAGETQAQAGDERSFCTTFRQLLDAAAERPAFHSLGRLGPMHAATGLGFDTCRIVPDLYSDRLVCSRARSAHNAGGAPPEGRIERCVPEALQMSEPADSRFTRFRLGVLAFYLERMPQRITFTLFAMPVER